MSNEYTFGRGRGHVMVPGIRTRKCRYCEEIMDISHAPTTVACKKPECREKLLARHKRFERAKVKTKKAA